MPNTNGRDATILALVFIVAVAVIVAIFSSFPKLESEQYGEVKLRLPSSFSEVQQLASVLSRYTDTHYFHVIAAYCATYVFLQTFSIPGSIFLSFLAGALFGLPLGLFLVASLSTIGATNCYFISFYLGRNTINKLFPDKLAWFGSEVSKHSSSLLNYVLFLRFTPVIPNWFVNIAAPLFSIPVRTFALGTFFGVLPQSFVAVKAGLTIQELKSASDVFDIRLFVTLFALAFLSILPTLQPVKNVIYRFLNTSSTDIKES